MDELLEKVKAEYKPADDCNPDENEPDYIKYGRLLHFFLYASKEQLTSCLDGKSEKEIDEFVKTARTNTRESHYLEKQRISHENHSLMEAQNGLSFALQYSADVQKEEYTVAKRLVAELRSRSDREKESFLVRSRYCPWNYEISLLMNSYRVRNLTGNDLVKRMQSTEKPLCESMTSCQVGETTKKPARLHCVYCSDSDCSDSD